MVRFDENSQFAGLYAVGHLMSSKWKISEKNHFQAEFLRASDGKTISSVTVLEVLYIFKIDPRRHDFQNLHAS